MLTNNIFKSILSVIDVLVHYKTIEGREEICNGVIENRECYKEN